MRTSFIATIVLLLVSVLAAINPDVLDATGGIPAHLAGRFRNVAGFQQAASGQYFVFDRGAQIVYGVDEAQTSVWEIVHIGAEPGRILDPTAFSVAPDGTFVVADSPKGALRIQIFTPAGFLTGGFTLPGRDGPRITFGGYVLNGIGSLQYTGRTILMSQPETGALVTEYALDGGESRTFGHLRRTGHEDDQDLHLALNSGIALVDPQGGFYFVFQTGEPVFRKYDAAGELVFERRIQGLEIDEFLGKLPTTWPTRRTADGEIPLVSPTIRTAAVDRSGNLWVTMVVPYTYVFDRQGDKIRVLQFRAAGSLTPNSLFFGSNGGLLVTPGLYEFDVRSSGPGDAQGRLRDR